MNEKRSFVVGSCQVERLRISGARRCESGAKGAASRMLVPVALAGAILGMSRVASAEPIDFEVGPWLGWAAGTEAQGNKRWDVFHLNVGTDATTLATTFYGPGSYGGPFEIRVGPWISFHIPMDRRASGEGGLTLLLTQTEHAQWGTFGVRAGAGYGGDHVAHIVTTVFGGVRYVPARTGRFSSGNIAKATGIRIVATARTTLEEVESTAFVFGIEFEPDYFLPPYELFKWGGKH